MIGATVRAIVGAVRYVSLRRQLQQLRQFQFMDTSEYVALQRMWLSRVLQHAYQCVPYYREVFQNLGCEGKDLADPERFYMIPFLTKEIIRREGERLASADLSRRRWYYNTSGGSTGEPVRFIQDIDFSNWDQAGKVLFDEWTGYRVGMPKAIIWGSERDIFSGRNAWWTRFKRWLKGEIWLNSFRMTESQMHDYISTINHKAPVLILAYVESAYELARFAKREKLTLWSPRAVMVSAGTLYPHMRRLIEEVFRAPVFNRYGSREVSDIACECDAHTGLHVAPTNYIEIIREDGSLASPGEVGEVVVTSLVNYAMPIIRYRIGDVAVWAERRCKCGRVWPLLKEIKGRVTDTFITMSGDLVHGEYFAHLLYFKDWIRRFQFIQEDYDYVRLLIVPTSDDFAGVRRLAEECANEITEKVRLVMGKTCRVDLELVREIAPSPSGKHRYTISKVKRL
jgi:phenylacetate-CoA ligase